MRIFFGHHFGKSWVGFSFRPRVRRYAAPARAVGRGATTLLGMGLWGWIVTLILIGAAISYWYVSVPLLVALFWTVDHQYKRQAEVHRLQVENASLKQQVAE